MPGKSQSHRAALSKASATEGTPWADNRQKPDLSNGAFRGTRSGANAAADSSSSQLVQPLGSTASATRSAQRQPPAASSISGQATGIRTGRAQFSTAASRASSSGAVLDGPRRSPSQEEIKDCITVACPPASSGEPTPTTSRRSSHHTVHSDVAVPTNAGDQRQRTAKLPRSTSRKRKEHGHVTGAPSGVSGNRDAVSATDFKGSALGDGVTEIPRLEFQPSPVPAAIATAYPGVQPQAMRTRSKATAPLVTEKRSAVLKPPRLPKPEKKTSSALSSDSVPATVSGPARQTKTSGQVPIVRSPPPVPAQGPDSSRTIGTQAMASTAGSAPRVATGVQAHSSGASRPRRNASQPALPASSPPARRTRQSKAPKQPKAIRPTWPLAQAEELEMNYADVAREYIAGRVYAMNQTRPESEVDHIAENRKAVTSVGGDALWKQDEADIKKMKALLQKEDE
ncbi:hypothetical protein P389DRAFT_33111 [Cystobasidium minutum MCA 4210]|uniref:uncharacterized protein n=1 Tax=Cystobasidium minutum MCA 4210 TaxID=1397322 RepID=UPI0034CF9EF3|eukprot:jgi/Rhomi1/33111/CE33110_166